MNRPEINHEGVVKWHEGVEIDHEGVVKWHEELEISHKGVEVEREWNESFVIVVNVLKA